MAQLFEKIVAFTDIHFGRRSNDRQANQDNENFITWFIKEAKAWGATQCVFLGDWHDNRHNLHVSTMNYSLSNMERLNDAFDKVWFIPGNHDLFYRDKRELNSIEFARNLSNVQIINKPMTIENVTFSPWLVGDEWKNISKEVSRYMFGHFELPNFYMNAMVEMPDHGELNESHFSHQEYIFSGHFHKRQARGKVVYIGNTFPFSFSDAGDDDRGMMFLEWGKEPFFKQWEEAPKYRILNLSSLLENPATMILPRSYNKVSLDVHVSYEETQFIRDTFTALYAARRIEMVPLNKQEEDQEYDPNVEFQSIDQIVVEGLNSVQSTGISNDMLVEIYKGLV